MPCHLELKVDIVNLIFVVARFYSICFLVLNFAAVCNQVPQNPLHILQSGFIRIGQEKA